MVAKSIMRKVDSLPSKLSHQEAVYNALDKYKHTIQSRLISALEDFYGDSDGDSNADDNDEEADD